jgi:hypothetical protein
VHLAAVSAGRGIRDPIPVCEVVPNHGVPTTRVLAETDLADFTPVAARIAGATIALLAVLQIAVLALRLVAGAAVLRVCFSLLLVLLLSSL